MRKKPHSGYISSLEGYFFGDDKSKYYERMKSWMTEDIETHGT